MKLQIIQDEKGKTTGVYIPVNVWKALTKQFRQWEKLKNKEPTKKEILLELKEAFRELKLIEQGKLKSRPARELLNEL